MLNLVRHGFAMLELEFRKEDSMNNIKYIGRDTDKLQHGKVHKIASPGKTGCGAIYSDNPQDWIMTTAPITCEKNGCKN